MTVRIASLHRRLIWRLIPALVAAIALGGVTAYFVAKRSADFAYDQALSAAAVDVAAGVAERFIFSKAKPMGSACLTFGALG